MKYLTQYVPQGSGGISDGYVAVEENGELKLQKLSFNGTEATPDGATEAIGNVGLFATGMDEPAYNGSGTGGSAKYYKCASVDTSNKTWSGYELVLQDGVYVVSETLTEGLSYSGFTPIVSTMYNEDATFVISNLFSKSDTLEGCVFAANMQSNAAMYNGETINLEGITLADAPGYTDGTKALHNTNDTLLDINMTADCPEGNFSLAFSAYWSSVLTGASYAETFVDLSDIVKVQQSSSNGYLVNSLYYKCGTYSKGANISAESNVITYGWHHIAITYDYSTAYNNLYIDGVLYQTDKYAEQVGGVGDNRASIMSISQIKTNMTSSGSYMKDLQIYNRVLTEDEVMSLYEKAKLPTA